MKDITSPGFLWQCQGPPSYGPLEPRPTSEGLHVQRNDGDGTLIYQTLQRPQVQVIPVKAAVLLMVGVHFSPWVVDDISQYLDGIIISHVLKVGVIHLIHTEQMVTEVLVLRLLQ